MKGYGEMSIIDLSQWIAILVIISLNCRSAKLLEGLAGANVEVWKVLKFLKDRAGRE